MCIRDSPRSTRRLVGHRPTPRLVLGRHATRRIRRPDLHPSLPRRPARGGAADLHRRCLVGRGRGLRAGRRCRPGRRGPRRHRASGLAAAAGAWRAGAPAPSVHAASARRSRLEPAVHRLHATLERLRNRRKNLNRPRPIRLLPSAPCVAVAAGVSRAASAWTATAVRRTAGVAGRTRAVGGITRLARRARAV